MQLFSNANTSVSTKTKPKPLGNECLDRETDNMLLSQPGQDNAWTRNRQDQTVLRWIFY